MRTLLINPWIYDFAAYDLWLKPFGLLRIGQLLRNWGWEVDFIDCLNRFHPCLPDFFGGRHPRRDRHGCGKYYKIEVTKPPPIENIERKYFRYGIPQELFQEEIDNIERPDLIFVGSTMTYWYPGYFLAIELAHASFPEVPIILGGIYPALCPDHARNNSGATLVHTKGGIQELTMILTKLGFAYPAQTYEMDLTPAYDFLTDRSALAVRTGLGCPNSCSYCATSILEPQFLQRSPKTVADEIIGYIFKYGTTDIAFYDNALLCNAEKHLNRILSILIKQTISCRFHTPNGLHARLLTRNTAELMKKSGFINPRLSLETTQQERQKQTGNKVATSELIRAVNYLENAGFERHEILVYLLYGLPGQNPEEVENDIHFVHGLGASVSLAGYSPIPDTMDYHRLLIDEIIEEEMDPLKQNNTTFCLGQKIFTSDQIRALRKLASNLNCLLL